MPLMLIRALLSGGYFALRGLLELVITAAIVVVAGATTGTAAGLATCAFPLPVAE